tara:strand:+ start:384 stop:578 length:195 start_codon:yes stop_codon:yes gene_type:complete
MKFSDLVFGAGIISLLIVCMALVAGLIELLVVGLYFMLCHPLQALMITLVISLAIYAVARFVSK